MPIINYTQSRGIYIFFIPYMLDEAFLKIRELRKHASLFETVTKQTITKIPTLKLFSYLIYTFLQK